MMDTTTAAVGTGVIVIAGRWSSGQPITIQIGIGVGVYALALSAMSSVSDPLAGKFAILVLIAAVFIYAVPMLSKLGLVGGAGPATAPGTGPK